MKFQGTSHIIVADAASPFNSSHLNPHPLQPPRLKTLMIQWLKNTFREVSDDKPGERFINHYLRRQEELNGAKLWKSYVAIAAGVALGIIGFLFSIPPGSPGFLLWIPGLGLIAARVKFVAVFLDKLESGSRSIYGKIRRTLSGNSHRS
ncbi:MAG: hypothetical protein ACLFVC_02665 [Opitutales bacterium]